MPVQLVLPQRIVYPKDVMAGEGWSAPLLLSDILAFVFGDRLTPFARKAHDRGKAVESFVRPGWVHVGKDKEDLQSQRFTRFVRTRNTLLQLASNGCDYMTFATFNVRQRKSWERRRTNISSVRAFVIDIDSKAWPASQIVGHAEAHGLVPSFINETPRGFHLWYVLDQEFIGPHERNGELTKVGQLYNDLNIFLIDFFDKAFPGSASGTDRLIGAERYIRIPRQIIHFSRQTYSITHLIQLKRELFKREKKPQKNNVQTMIPKHAILADPAWKSLLSAQPTAGKRRYTAFTISLFCRAIGYAEDKTLSILKSWYDGLANKRDFKWAEIERTMHRAYSGRYKGPNSDWVEKLTGMRPKIYISRKTAHERTNKSLSYWENLFCQMLNAKGGTWMISNRDLCAALGLSSRAMLDQMVASLITKGHIRKSVSGHGRAAQTVYFLLQSPTDPEPKNKVVSLAAYRAEKRVLSSGLNDPFLPMPYYFFIGDGGRGLVSLSEPDDTS